MCKIHQKRVSLTYASSDDKTVFCLFPTSLQAEQKLHLAEKTVLQLRFNLNFFSGTAEFAPDRADARHWV
jgi:hypothetical protein